MSAEISSAPETKTHPFSDFLSVSRAWLSNLECQEKAKAQFDQLATQGAHKYERWNGLEKWSSVLHTANFALDGIKKQGLPLTAMVFEQMLVEEVIVPSKPSGNARSLNPKAISQAILASEQLVTCNDEKGRHDLAWQLLQARYKSLQQQMREIKVKPQPDTNGLYLSQLASQQALVFSALKELGPLHQPKKN